LLRMLEKERPSTYSQVFAAPLKLVTLETPAVTTIGRSNDGRVVRNGSYYNNQDSVRVTYRESSSPDFLIQFNGFRVVCLSPSQDD
jgi:formylglycine-generating enzyme required for sulfatase activity